MKDAKNIEKSSIDKDHSIIRYSNWTIAMTAPITQLNGFEI